MNNSMGKFNMNCEDVIKAIERIYRLEAIDANFDIDDVYIAVENSDYYVRPGVSKARFMYQFQGIFTEYKKMAKETDAHTAQEVIMLMKFINLIKSSFDEKYFKEQIARRRRSVGGSKDTLRNYLKKLDENQLKAFYQIIVHYRVNHGLFVSNTSSDDMWEDFNRACRKIDNTIPSEFDLPEGKKFISKNPLYFFDYLNKKSIANRLCEAIDLDVALAGSAAKKFYKCGFEATLHYLNMKLNDEAFA